MMNSEKFVMIATWSMAYDALNGIYQQMENNQIEINEAIVKTISQIEDYPFYKSVGYGGLPNRQGRLQLDASFMDGNTLKIGCVAAMEGFANPIKVAYQLKDQEFNSFLVGRGAEEYALSHGFEQKNMLTKRALHLYEERQEKIERLKLTPYTGHDTVCILGRDQQGRISAGTSTSGLFMKERGRVGDSPISGSGFYANSSSGACAATGLGEDIMKTCISYEVVRLISEGYPAQDAANHALKKATNELMVKYGKCGDISIVCCDHYGNYGSATNLDEFSYVVFTEKFKPVVMLVTKEQVHKKADQAWLDNYYQTRHKKLT